MSRGIFGSLFRSKKVDEPRAVTRGPEILGLRLGGMVKFDALRLQLIEPKMTFEGAADTQCIQAIGEVKLDENEFLWRFYTDDEGFIQVHLSGGTGEEHIKDVQLWYFFDTTSIAEQDRDIWNSMLKAYVASATYVLDDNEFKACWQDASGAFIPVAMTEETLLSDGQRKRTDQFAMLYARQFEGDPGQELCLVCAEESFVDGRPERALVRATGVGLASTDFEAL